MANFLTYFGKKFGRLLINVNCQIINNKLNVRSHWNDSFFLNYNYWYEQIRFDQDKFNLEVNFKF